jgi:hypothetical protein
VAEPGLGSLLPIVLFDAIRVKIRNEGKQPSGVPGDCGALLGPQENPWPLDRADRRREILAAGDDRTAQSRHPGHSDRGGRWA